MRSAVLYVECIFSLWFSTIALPGIDFLQALILIFTFIHLLISTWEKVRKLKTPKNWPLWKSKIWKFSKAFSQAGKKTFKDNGL